MKRQSDAAVAFPSMQAIAFERDRLRRKRAFGKAFWRSVGLLLVVAAIAVLLAMLFLPTLRVTGTSMEPNICDGDILVGFKTGEFATGQICCFYFNNKILLKRVIGSAGDFIDMDENGGVYVNGQLLDEPYVREHDVGISDVEFPLQVPDGKLFVMGDHRVASVDSRSSTVGFIDVEDVVGRMFFRVWPFQNFGMIETEKDVSRGVFETTAMY